MSEVFFILTTVFVAYVVFSVVSDERKPASKNTQAKKSPAPAPKPAETKVTAAKEEPAVKEKTETAAKAATDSEEAFKAKPVSASAGDSLKNPETGEVAKIPSNYRFSKRWIKEALVKEGLLDKIYKNNELNDEANAKIKQALADLKAIEKYQP